MPTVIWKFPLDLFEAGQNGARLKIEMPINARILHVGTQRDNPVLWAEVDDPSPSEWREFIIVGTGRMMPDDRTRYLGTTTTHDGTFDWHIYEGTANERRT